MYLAYRCVLYDYILKYGSWGFKPQLLLVQSPEQEADAYPQFPSIQWGCSCVLSSKSSHSLVRGHHLCPWLTQRGTEKHTEADQLLKILESVNVDVGT